MLHSLPRLRREPTGGASGSGFFLGVALRLAGALLAALLAAPEPRVRLAFFAGPVCMSKLPASEAYGGYCMGAAGALLADPSPLPAWLPMEVHITSQRKPRTEVVRSVHSCGDNVKRQPAHTCSLPSLLSAEALLRLLLAEGVSPLVTPRSSHGQSCHLERAAPVKVLLRLGRTTETHGYASGSHACTGRAWEC